MDAVRHHWLQALQFGNTRAVCDCAHPAMRGPQAGCDAFLVLHPVTEAEQAALEAGEAEGFEWPHGADERAFIPWAAVLAVTFPQGPDQFGVVIQETLPARFGKDAPFILRRALHEVLKVARQPEVLWSFFPGPGADQPDKRSALEALLADPTAFLFVAVTTKTSGLIVQPPQPTQRGLTTFLLAREGLKLNGVFVEGHQLGSTGRVRVPWGAIGALQDGRGRGWFWPADLPEGLSARFDGRRGVPLRQVAARPLVTLPPLQMHDKFQAVQACRQAGGAVLLVDPRAEGAVVPGDFGRLPFLAVPLDAPEGMEVAAPRVTALFIDAALPDFTGQVRRLRLPWNALFAIATHDAPNRLYAWSQDYPAELHEALGEAAALEAAEADEALEAAEPAEVPVPRGAVWGLHRDGGQIAVFVRQPVGPLVDDQQPVLELSFRLPAEAAG